MMDKEKQYIVYLTIYSGDKMPAFYIGSTSKKRYNNGYLGSVSSKKYKDIFNFEVKNNNELFDILILSEHSSREEALEAEYYIHNKLNVKNDNRFINLSHAQKNGFFGLDGENNYFYNNPVWKGKTQTQNHIEKRKSCGEKNGMYGKNHTDEAKKKISIASSGENNPMHHSNGRIPPALGRTGEKHPQFGKHWYHNPETYENVICLPNEMPIGYIKGKSPKTREVK